jgi:hypothetical protein
VVSVLTLNCVGRRAVGVDGALVGQPCGAPCCGATFTVADWASDVAKELSRASSGE